MTNLKFYKPPLWLNITVAAMTVVSLVGVVPFGSLLSTQKALAADTGFLTPTSTHLPNDWDVNTVANVQTSDNVYISDNDEGDQQGYEDFNFPTIPAGSLIDGIEVQAEVKASDTSGCQLEVALSWNNGGDFTSIKTQPLTGADSALSFGGLVNTWGRTWTTSDFTNANFVVRLSFDDVSSNDCQSNTTSVDYLQAKVYYGPALSWPLSSGWTTPAQCSVDLSGDESPSEADLVGTLAGPAVGFQEDSDYFYFRERVADNPKSGSTWKNTAWVVLMQTSTPSYQYLLALNGDDEKVEIWQNTPPGTAVDFSPLFNDPANTKLWEGAAATYATSSSAGGGQYFVDWAIPKSVLASLGITIGINTTKFFATSQNSNNYNKDHLNCYEQIADLGVVKTDNVDPVDVGDTLTYTITVINNGPDSSVGVVVNDTLPTGLTYASHSTATGSYNNLTGVWTVGTLANGASATLTINATVEAGASGTTLSNTATVTATTLDNVSTNDSDTETTDVNALPTTGTLIVVKVVTNNNGGLLEVDDFSFQVDGGTAVPFEPDGQNDLTVPSDTYTVTEVPVPGYTASYDNCSNVNVPAGGSATCTITNNDDAPSLTLVKEVTNDNGGTAVATDWLLSATGGLTPISGLGGAVSDGTFKAGTYALGESGGPSGYTPSSWSCVGGVQNDSSITLGLSQSATCTITNDDVAPSLTLVKSLITDDGGLETETDWILTATGAGQSSTNLSGTTPVASDASFKADTYTLDETGPSGYSTTGWSCVKNSGQPVSSALITLDLGDTATCTIINDDIRPKLTVTKIVNNDDGGNNSVQSFSLFVNGSSVTSGVQNEYPVGTHTVSEEDPGVGYVGTIGGNCDEYGNVELLPGDVKECTITNNDVAPGLTLIKNVVNNNGGTAAVADFDLFIDQTEVISGNTNQIEANIEYTLIETNLLGYEAGSWSCDGGSQNGNKITLSEGETVTCTITNNDYPPSLTLVKQVVKDNGGTADATDWTLMASGPSTISGAGGATSDSTFQAGIYTLSETSLSGYTAGEWSCVKNSGQPVTGASIDLSIGDTATCTIINDDEPGTLIVEKEVLNDSGTGSANPEDFSFAVNGGNPIQFETDGENELTVDAGTYSVTEPSVTGYTTTYDNCTDVVMPNGGTATCTITNDDNDPTEGTLTVTKVVVNDDQTGSAVISDFSLKVDDTVVTSGDANSFLAGDYVISETGPSGYAASFDGDCDEQGNIMIVAGEDHSCTITNDDADDALPPVSQFDDERNYQIISTEIVQLSLTGNSEDLPNPGGSGVASAEMGIYRIVDAETAQREGFYGEQSEGGFFGTTCSPLPQDAVQIELVSLNLTSTSDPMVVTWAHNFTSPDLGVYCAIVHATDNNGNVENTGVAGPFAFSPPAAPPSPPSGGGGGGGGGGSPLADLGVTIDIPGGNPTTGGSTFTYLVTLTNYGPSTATNAVVTNVLPGQLTYISSSSGQGSYDSTTNKWNVGTLPVGASTTLNLTVSLAAGVTGSVTNFASAISSENDPVLANNTDTYVFEISTAEPTPQVLGAVTELPRTGAMPISSMFYLSWLAPFFERFRLRKIKK